MVRTMKRRKDEDMVTTFKEVYDELKTKGHQPKLHVLDNECSKAVKNYIVTEKTCRRSPPWTRLSNPAQGSIHRTN